MRAWCLHRKLTIHHHTDHKTTAPKRPLHQTKQNLIISFLKFTFSSSSFSSSSLDSLIITPRCRALSLFSALPVCKWVSTGDLRLCLIDSRFNFQLDWHRSYRGVLLPTRTFRVLVGRSAVWRATLPPIAQKYGQRKGLRWLRVIWTMWSP